MKKAKSEPPVVMLIGGMDPSGGAGLCADIQALSAMGCHAAPVVSAITIQDTKTVSSFQALSANTVELQMRAVLDDLAPPVVKTGMLASREIVSVVAAVLSEHPEIKLIVDPVFSSNNDESLSEGSLIEVLKKQLIPLAIITTPNIPEAGLLAGKTFDADQYPAELGDYSYLITGTHENSIDVINRYYWRGSKLCEWVWPRLKHEYHGSGCTLASAIAAGIANGLEIEPALEQAQQFVFNSLQAGFCPGHGQHIPNRLCSA